MNDTTPMRTRAPLRFNPSLEHAEEDEAQTIDELLETMRDIGEKTLEDSGHATRSAHAKSHGLLIGELRVLDNLPASLAQGVFAHAATYPVILRLSTVPGDMLDDSVSLPRGLGLKIIGVEGDRLPGSEGDTTQDLVMVNGPAFLKPDAKSFLKSLRLIARTTDRGQSLKKVLSAVLRGTEKTIEAFGGKSTTVVALGGHPETHILGETFFTQVPLRHGDYIAKLAVAPVSPELVALTQAPLDVNGKPNGLRDAVVGHFAHTGGEWEVRVQLCTDLEAMPIEDASVVWPEDASPYVAVARITVAPQPAWTEARSAAIDDRLAFNPWHGIAAHRPLGSVMRARRRVYEEMSRFRAMKNGVAIGEPHSIEELAL